MGTVQTVLEIEPRTTGVQRVRDLLAESAGFAASIKGDLGASRPGGGGAAPGGGGGARAPSPDAQRAEFRRTHALAERIARTGGPEGGGSAMQRFLTGGQMSGRQIGGLGSLGFVGMAANRGIQSWLQYQTATLGAEPGLAGGMASGDYGTAAHAAIQYQATRETAAAHARYAPGEMAGQGMMMAGGVMAMSGAGVVPGIAMMALGAVVDAASKFGAAAAESMIQTLAAKEGAAVERGQGFFSARVGMGQQSLAMAPYGRGMPSDADLRNLGSRYGYKTPEIGQRLGAFGKAGGWGISDESILANERGYGVDASSQGRYARSLLPSAAGMSTLPAGMTPETHLRAVLTDAVAAGVQTARLPEYLNRLVGINESFQDRGLPIRAEGTRRAVAGLANMGWTPWEATTAVSGANQFGASTIQGLAGQILPGGASQALLLRGLIKKFGSVKGAMMGGQKMIETGEMPEFLSGIQGGLGDLPGLAFGMQTTGMFPKHAAHFAHYKPAAGVAGAGATAEERAAEYMGRPEAGPVGVDVLRDQMMTLGESLRGAEGRFADILGLAADALVNYANHINEANEKLRTERSGATPAPAWYERPGFMDGVSSP